jgi:hypothetical protein
MTSTTNSHGPIRSRWIAALALALAASAFAIRFAPDFVMMVLRTYGDDVLVAVAAYLLIGAACRGLAGWKVLLITLALTWAFETAHLFRPAWMGPLWARLQFEWSDMASFGVGALVAFGIERQLARQIQPLPG